MYRLTPYNRRRSAASRWPASIFNMDSWFDSFFSNNSTPVIHGFDNQIKVDIKENKKDYVIEADLPGVDKKDINIELRDNVLTIGVQRNETTEEERENYLRKERRTSAMSRSFRVENIKPEDVKAEFKNGVLSISLPKTEEEKDNKQYKVDIN